MKHLLAITFFVFASFFINAQYVIETVVDELKAMPSAHGYGKNSTGGRGGPVRLVTNLNATGAGSNKSAMESGSGYVVYNVAGRIQQTSVTNIFRNTTTFGQSAYRNNGGGVEIINNGNYNAPLIMRNVQDGNGNITLRYVTAARGRGVAPENGGDCITLVFQEYCMIDHVSMRWATDELLDLSYSKKITTQNSIFAEALHYSTHEYTTDTNNGVYKSPHSMASIFANAQDITMLNNIVVSNNQRNFLIQPTTLNPNFEVVNNIFYNWGAFGSNIQNASFPLNMNLIGNLSISGTDSNGSRYFWVTSGIAGNSIYLNENTSNYGSLNDQWAMMGDLTYVSPAPTSSQSLTPNALSLELENYQYLDNSEVKASILGHVGNSIVRDSHDTRIVGYVQNESGARLVNEDGETTGGFPQFTSFTGGYQAITPMSSAPTDTNVNGIDDSLEASGAVFPNGIKIPDEIVLTGSHNQVIPYFILNSTGQRWYNPGYELIEVVYFNDLDISEMTWGFDSSNTNAHFFLAWW